MQGIGRLTGLAVRHLRLEIGFSQTRLAESLGITLTRLRQSENGDVQLTERECSDLRGLAAEKRKERGESDGVVMAIRPDAATMALNPALHRIPAPQATVRAVLESSAPDVLDALRLAALEIAKARCEAMGEVWHPPTVEALEEMMARIRARYMAGELEPVAPQEIGPEWLAMFG